VPGHTTGVLFVILSVAIGGLIIGALGRLAVPGRQPLGLIRTILVGIAGSFLGAVVARLIWTNPQQHRMGLIVLEVLAAALIVYLLGRGRRRYAGRARRSRAY
jgi:uncharacterized membrane protein YeaQ/YmgE (transglycosylase-associated protein family)